MKTIEPETLVEIADEIDRHSNFCHEQLDILISLLLKLEEDDFALWKPDLQFLAGAFHTMANETGDDPDPIDYLPNLRAALGQKYMKAVGRE